MLAERPLPRLAERVEGAAARRPWARPMDAGLDQVAGGAAFTSSLVRPLFTDVRVILGIPAGDRVLVVLVQQQPLLLARPALLAARTRTKRPRELLAVQVEVELAGLDGRERVLALRTSSHVPQSHTITSPPPYSPAGITPSKSK